MSMLSNSAWVDELILAQAEASRRPAPDLAARLESPMRSTPPLPVRPSLLEDPDHLDALFKAVRAGRSRAAGQSSANTVAPWSEIIAKVQERGQTSSIASTSDDPHGWSSIISQVEREQTQSNFAASGATSEADRSWTEIIRAMNAKVGASA
jgi:hypothetical protein